MKNYFKFILFFLLLSSVLQAQKVSEKCVGDKCDAGLYCVELKNKEKWCCECDQNELNKYTKEVDDKCKYFEERGGFYQDKHPFYKDARAYDGRIRVGVYDEILEDCKECMKAREDRDDECWDGGNSGHKQIRDQLQTQIRRIVEDKEDGIEEKNVFFCSKSSYEGYLRLYDSKCNGLNTSNIEDALESMERDVNNNVKIDCDALKKYFSDCEECYKAAYDFSRYCFNDRSDDTPDDVEKKKKDTDALEDLAKRLLEKAKSNDLCK